MWGGVRYERHVVVVPLLGICTKMFVPPTIVSVGVVGLSRGRWRKGVGLFKLKYQSVLQNLVPDVW